MRKVWIVGFMAIAVVGCESKEDRQARQDMEAAVASDRAHEAEAQARALSDAQATIQKFGTGNICRAAIGALMGRNPDGIKIVADAGDHVITKYTREGKVWGNKCTFEGDRVLWQAAVDGAWGRVRDEDEIKFSTDHDALHIVGSSYGEIQFDKKYQF